MAKTFEAQVDAWVKKSEARLLAVFRLATEYVFDEVRDRTRWDTNFMRASFMASTAAPQPIKKGDRPVPGQTYQLPSYSLVIAGAQLGDTIWGTFTAEYAPVWEFRDGMIRLSAQNWQSHVNRAVAEAKARIG